MIITSHSYFIYRKINNFFNVNYVNKAPQNIVEEERNNLFGIAPKTIYENIENLDKYKEKLPDRGYYYAIIEYGDDDGDYFSELEHHIMPNLSFVFERISHH